MRREPRPTEGTKHCDLDESEFGIGIWWIRVPERCGKDPVKATGSFISICEGKSGEKKRRATQNFDHDYGYDYPLRLYNARTHQTQPDRHWSVQMPDHKHQSGTPIVCPAFADFTHKIFLAARTSDRVDTFVESRNIGDFPARWSVVGVRCRAAAYAIVFPRCQVPVK
ncbi:hypothetical protein PM082_014035 [Marasmius tenuissimus]|nr:hypothetical protein PM082_014035 [Marasmius tenuissimus]